MVHDFYDAVAEKWHGTRYKSWPNVRAWIEGRPSGLVCEVGCGNGKNLPFAQGFALGSDVSTGLLEFANCSYDEPHVTPKNAKHLTEYKERRWDVHVGDIMHLPYKSDGFDTLLCIAVLHHVSTKKRRVRAMEECLRVLRPGGRALFYAWAWEQKKTASHTKHRFETQDVVVPFAANDAVVDRYCHVFAQGELEDLVAAAGNGIVIESWDDTGNHAIVVEKKA